MHYSSDVKPDPVGSATFCRSEFVDISTKCKAKLAGYFFQDMNVLAKIVKIMIPYRTDRERYNYVYRMLFQHV
jgi:hypothetical protein